jgi:hypothetical protein
VPSFGHAHRTVAPIRERLSPLFEIVTSLPYAALQQMLDAAAPFGLHAYEKSLDLVDLTDDMITVITEHAARKTSPLSFVPAFYLNGAFCRVGENDTAFSGRRNPHYPLHMNGTRPDAEGLTVERTWVRSLWDTLRPLAQGDGGYVNFIGEADDNQVRASYGPEKYERLARVKAEYDPGNVMHRNANIKPA